MRKVLLLTAAALLAWQGCAERSPKRDQIPLLRENILKLQNAVKDHSRAAIDSLLSVKIISKNQGSDSLLNYVYGPQGQFPFERFGNCSIIYTSDKARIECFIMDSTGQTDRPLTFFLAREHDLWLFTSFEPGVSESDTAK
jgi:hypothetical protein